MSTDYIDFSGRDSIPPNLTNTGISREFPNGIPAGFFDNRGGGGRAGAPAPVTLHRAK
jgi:hypothetical protein